MLDEQGNEIVDDVVVKDDGKQKKSDSFEDWNKDFDTIMTGDEPEEEKVASDDNAGDTGDGSPAGEDVFSVLGWDKEVLSAIEKLNPKILEDVKGLLEKSAEKTSIDAEAEADAKKKAEELEAAKKAESSKVVISPDEVKLLKDKLGPEASAVIEKLLAHTESLEKSLGAVTSERQTEIQDAKDQELVIDFRKANKVMDELAKDFPILGSSEKLPKDKEGKLDGRNSSVKERAVIWNHAEALRNAGIVESFDEALAEATNWYRGKHGENLAMRKVVKDLNATKKGFTPRPTHNHTQGKKLDEKTADGKAAVISEIFDEIGIKD